MPYFSTHSKDLLAECDPRIQEIMNIVIKIIDCRVITGKRTEEEQNRLYHANKTQLRYPYSYHNKEPFSKAIDVVPYPVDWNDRERFIYFAGIVMGVAEMLGYTLTWGGDWDRDFQVKDNNFDDLGHFQLED